jgi:hypothetical protein
LIPSNVSTIPLEIFFPWFPLKQDYGNDFPYQFISVLYFVDPPPKRRDTQYLKAKQGAELQAACTVSPINEESIKCIFMNRTPIYPLLKDKELAFSPVH